MMHQNDIQAFTLIELMIVVAIIGILAAVAVPNFTTYIQKAKMGEAPLLLNSMTKLNIAYYESDRFDPGSFTPIQKSYMAEDSDIGLQRTPTVIELQNQDGAKAAANWLISPFQNIAFVGQDTTQASYAMFLGPTNDARTSVVAEGVFDFRGDDCEPGDNLETENQGCRVYRMLLRLGNDAHESVVTVYGAD